MRNMSRLASDYFDGIYSNFSTHIDRCHLRARKYSVSQVPVATLSFPGTGSL